MSAAPKNAKHSVLNERTARAQVNLLPPEIGEGRQFQRVTRYLAYVLLGFVALVGLVYVMALGAVSSAEDRLTAAQDEEARLRAERVRYSAVLAVENHLNTSIAAESHAMLYEVDWQAYLDGIAAITPESITYAEVTYSGASAVNGLLEPGNQLFGETIGAIAINGVTADLAEYGNWIRAVNALPGLEGTWVLSSSANEDEQGGLYWEFSGEIIVAEDALSGRFVADDTSEEDPETTDAESETEEEEG